MGAFGAGRRADSVAMLAAPFGGDEVASLVLAGCVIAGALLAR